MGGVTLPQITCLSLCWQQGPQAGPGSPTTAGPPATPCATSCVTAGTVLTRLSVVSQYWAGSGQDQPSEGGSSDHPLSQVTMGLHPPGAPPSPATSSRTPVAGETSAPPAIAGSETGQGLHWRVPDRAQTTLSALTWVRPSG